MAAIELEQLNWPLENRAPKPYLREYLPEEALIRRAEDPLMMSAALEVLYDDPVTSEQLQAELEREAVATNQPERLRELWAALGNDPALIAEAVARPILAENRLRAHYYADERIHGALKAQALEELSGLGDSSQLRTLSGSYHEVEYRLVPEGEKDYDDQEDLDQGIERRNPIQWKELLASMGELFGREDLKDPWSLRGAVSGLRESTEYFFARAIVAANAGRIRIGTICWAKTPFGAWWERSRDGFEADAVALNAEESEAYSLPEISPRGFTNGEGWRAISTTGAPTGRTHFVWQLVSSSQIIAWGGQNVYGSPFNSGGLYNLTTDSWQATSTGTNCPVAQLADTWAWTGTQLIIWNGATQSGARYNLAGNTWSTMTSASNPGHRDDYTMVWSGTYAILWGGVDNLGVPVNTGGKYNPTTDTWTATATGANLPAGRDFHTATWDIATGFMHVWGGMGGSCLNSGGVYNGSATWYSMSSSGAPSARWHHAQVPYYFNGFLVWGGEDCGSSFLNTGGWYDGDTSGSWHTITTTGAPTAREYFAGIFGYNGRQMIIWGGMTQPSNVDGTGGRYMPQFNSWATLSTQDAPEARRHVKGVDIANEGLAMVVWGGDNMGPASTSYLNSGAVYIYTEYTPTLQASPVTATDLNPCSQGIQITWQDASNWHDSGFGTRSYEIYRNGSLLVTRSYGTTSYTDSATAAGTTYSYAVRYISGVGLYTDSGSVSASDAFGVAPSSLANNAAADTGACVDTGVAVSWSAPGNWGDNGVGTRTFDILRGGTAIATGLPASTTSYTDWTGANGTSYTYAVRAINGCALTTTTAGVSAMDYVSTAPSSLTNNTAADVSVCADTGVTITWAKDAGNWNDNGSGTRTYDVLRDGSDLASGIAYNTLTYPDTTGVNGTNYTYAVRYRNGCANIAATTGVSAADAIDTTPCGAVGSNLKVTKSGSNASLAWTAVTCGDLANYRVYGATSYNATFPSGWALLGSPTGTTTTNALNSTYKAYAVVTVDQCGNASGN